jgi:S1-C subfamily serine protease
MRDNNFSAGNEVRFIELRYVRTRGSNISAVRMVEDVGFAEAVIYECRRGQGYLEYLDLNGQYGVLNVERQNHELESEYMLVTFNLKTDEGVVITNVESGSPGARDGLRKGDVILEIERTPVTDMDTFRNVVSKLNPSDHVLLLILREERSFYTILHAPRG